MGLALNRSRREKPSDGVVRDKIARAKLMMIDNARCLEDLRVPPANHLELLHGDREGQYSIRINIQYRICFNVDGNDFFNVEIVDYHS